MTESEPVFFATGKNALGKIRASPIGTATNLPKLEWAHFFPLLIIIIKSHRDDP
jgi:hypothetical protein